MFALRFVELRAEDELRRDRWARRSVVAPAATLRRVDAAAARPPAVHEVARVPAALPQTRLHERHICCAAPFARVRHGIS